MIRIQPCPDSHRILLHKNKIPVLAVYAVTPPLHARRARPGAPAGHPQASRASAIDADVDLLPNRARQRAHAQRRIGPGRWTNNYSRRVSRWEACRVGRVTPMEIRLHCVAEAGFCGLSRLIVCGVRRSTPQVARVFSPVPGVPMFRRWPTTPFRVPRLTYAGSVAPLLDGGRAQRLIAVQ